MLNIKEKGFTLIELLVVIAIISILASILFVAIDPAAQRNKANDAKRITFMNELEKALILYSLDNNGEYPHYSFNTYHNDGGAMARSFENDVKNYMPVSFKEDWLNNWNPKRETAFFYKSPSADNYYHTHGIMIMLKRPENNHYELDDGGHYSYYYELGELPKYCEDKYNGTWHTGTNKCAAGN